MMGDRCPHLANVRKGEMSRKALVVIVFAVLAFNQFNGISKTAGVDFYPLWAIPTAFKLSRYELGSPYHDERYAEVIVKYAEKSDDPKLNTISHRRRLTVIGTPLLYFILSWFPEDYTSALSLFRIVQAVLYLSSLILLGRLYRYDWFLISCFALILMAFQPLLSDLGVGNVNSIQLFDVTLILAISEYLLRGREGRRTGWLGAALLVACSFLALFKPNFSLIPIVMVTHFWVRHGGRALISSGVRALGFSALFVVAPCLYFGSWSIWIEWYQRLTGRGLSRFANPVDLGNRSSVVMIDEWLQVGVLPAEAMIAILLATSLAIIVAWGCWDELKDQRWRGAFRAALDRVFGDPGVSLAIGIVVTLAVSPLVWSHYYVVALVPWLALAYGAPRLSLAGALAGGTMLMSSGVLDTLLPLEQDRRTAMVAFSWVPLWGAVLVELWQSRKDAILSGEGR